MTPRTIVCIATDCEGGICVACDDGTVLYWQDPRPDDRYLPDGRVERRPRRPGKWVALEPVPGTAAALAKGAGRIPNPDDGGGR